MDRRALSIRAGLVAPPILLVGVVLAVILDPAFSWTDGTLSHLGEVPAGRTASLGLLTSHPEFLLFNAGLILGALLGLPFAWLCYRTARHPLERSGSVMLGLAFLGLLGMGVFYRPSPFHVPAALVHVLSTTAFLWVYGSGATQTGRTRFGAVTGLLGVALVGFWLLWGQYLGFSGTAVPEFAGIAVLGGWTFTAAARSYHATEGRSVGDGLRGAVDAVWTAE